MYILAVLVVVCGLYPGCVHSQCTTKYCYNDSEDLDTDMSSMMIRLQQQLKEQQDMIQSLQKKLEDNVASIGSVCLTAKGPNTKRA
ncbi:hypothetical protein LSAT2_031879 [Lamellibrachia satsuma]|nr:hypothetical protein LSAT2_031879 [Lamellibrachia satsuma]